ncbi:MAG TPA: hypothetical protein VLJ44_12310 [Gaiellaceae bacterium]|nr:hypothetical protein [Gaiellaceae bacterium]
MIGLVTSIFMPFIPAIECMGVTVEAGFRAPAGSHVAAVPTATASAASVMSNVFGISALLSRWTRSTLRRPTCDHMGSAAHLLRRCYPFVPQ